MRRILVGFTALLVLGLASTPASAVIGGRNASQPYPFMASLQDSGGHFCGASLIAPQVALTAAHCVPDEQPGGLAVMLGRTRLNGSGGEEIPVASVEVHESYSGSPGGGYDIALLTLEAPSAAAPIRLAAAAERPLFEPGDSVRVTGWGSAIFLVGPGNNELQEVDVPIVSDADCEEVYSEYDPATMVCAGEATGLRDSCQGDSGGPLFAFDAAGAAVQFGTVSYGLGCGFPGFYGVYGRVGEPTLRDWIAARVPSVNAAPGSAPAPAPAPAPPPASSPAAAPTPAPGQPATVTRLRYAQNLGSVRTARKRKRIRLRVEATERVRDLRATVTDRRGRRTLARAIRTRLGGRATLTLRVARRARLTAGSVRITLSATDAQGRRVSVSGIAFLRR